MAELIIEHQKRQFIRGKAAFQNSFLIGLAIHKAGTSSILLQAQVFDCYGVVNNFRRAAVNDVEQISSFSFVCDCFSKS